MNEKNILICIVCIILSTWIWAMFYSMIKSLNIVFCFFYNILNFKTISKNNITNLKYKIRILYVNYSMQDIPADGERCQAKSKLLVEHSNTHYHFFISPLPHFVTKNYISIRNSCLSGANHQIRSGYLQITIFFYKTAQRQFNSQCINWRNSRHARITCGSILYFSWHCRLQNILYLACFRCLAATVTDYYQTLTTEICVHNLTRSIWATRHELWNNLRKGMGEKCWCMRILTEWCYFLQHLVYSKLGLLIVMNHGFNLAVETTFFYCRTEEVAVDGALKHTQTSGTYIKPPKIMWLLNTNDNP